MSDSPVFIRRLNSQILTQIARFRVRYMYVYESSFKIQNEAQGKFTQCATHASIFTVAFCKFSNNNRFDSLSVKVHVQVGNDQEKAQSERDSHFKNRGGNN